MNSHFNRQFILLDFRLLEDPRFLQLISSSEFATYLVLRRNIWRSADPHYMGLHELYEQQKQLVCSLTREKIAEVTNVALDNISRHLSALTEKGVIKRVRTGRQNIYVLGEWVDVQGDGSYRVEWFYLEGSFGFSKSDLMLSVRSDGGFSSDQIRPETSGQTRRSASDNNREENREENKKPVNGDASIFKKLPNLDQPKAKTEYVANYILEQLGDKQSTRFYKLIAAKIPEHAIRAILSEINVDGARDPAKLFTYKIKQYAQRYALQRMKKTIGH